MLVVVDVDNAVSLASDLTSFGDRSAQYVFNGVARRTETVRELTFFSVIILSEDLAIQPVRPE
jgi:hypothetical protein